MKVNCSFCEVDSNEYPVMPYIYKNKMMNMCMECLMDSMFEHFNDETPEGVQVFGVQCPECEKTWFTEEFPVKCVCGFMISELNNKIKMSKKKDNK